MTSLIILICVLVPLSLAYDRRFTSKSDDDSNRVVTWLQSEIATLRSLDHARLDESDITFSPHPSPAVTCHGVKCPKFKTMGKCKDYEKRCYDSINWVHTWQHVGLNDTVDLSPMYRQLLAYINGYNVEKIKMKKTLPMMLRVRRLKDEQSNPLELLFHFYVPPEMVKRMPKPLDKKITFPHMGRICFFVRSFKGYVASYGNVLKEQTKKLLSSLARDKRYYQKNKVFFMAYDFPDMYADRYNEVLVKTNHRLPIPKICQ